VDKNAGAFAEKHSEVFGGDSSDLIALAEVMAYFPTMVMHRNIHAARDFLKSSIIVISDSETAGFRLA